MNVGDIIGSYRVLEKLGEGGMGEVYRARDTKLGRDVALKVLPDRVAGDLDRPTRFEREAHVLASLNHPNIAAIYGMDPGTPAGDDATGPVLVMELVEGPTLADRIARGPMTLQDALPISREIAAGLEAAHAQGIVHRDLKPANIKVRPDGTVKILDFGLAKALTATGEGSGGEQLMNSPTITAGTEVGMILGTAAYMAPEQARGQAVDKRADIWAFGCVLYEMLTGKRPFAGDDLTLTLAAIVKDQADLAAAPAPVRKLLARCLEKDPRKRLRDIGDAFDLIEDAPIGEAVMTAMPRRWALLPWALVAVTTVAAAGLGAARWFDVPSPPTTTRFLIPWPAVTGKVDAGESRFFEVSPDGRYFAIVSQGALWIRSVDQIDPIRLDRTDGATYPFWSPDSSFIGFFADGQLKKIARTGGVVQRLCDAAGPRGGTWGPDGSIVFAGDGGNKGLSRVSDAGGSVSAVTTMATLRTSAAHRYPQFLPDGRRFLFLHLAGEPSVGGVYVGSLDGAQPVRILEAGEAAQFAPSPTGGVGHLLFVQVDTLMAQAFDPATLRLSGSPSSIVDFVSQGENTGIARFSAGRSGVLAHSGMGGVPSELNWFDRQGKPLGRQASASMIDTFALDDLDRRLVLAISNPSGRQIDLWLQSGAAASLSKLTFGPVPGWLYPVWSPGGADLAYSTVDNLGYSSYEIRRRSMTDANRETVLFRGSDLIYLWDWSRDGQFVVMNRDNDLWQLPLEGQRTPVQLTDTLDLNEQYGQVSANGRWLAYSVVAEGKEVVYVQPLRPTGSKWLISPEGGSMPRWQRDGRALFFRAPDGRLRSVAVTGAELSRAAAAFEHREVETLAVTVPTARNIFRFTYQPSTDGRRFLVAVPVETSLAPTTVVLNWQAALKD